MHKTATSVIALLVAASLWSPPVGALERRSGGSGRDGDWPSLRVTNTAIATQLHDRMIARVAATDGVQFRQFRTSAFPPGGAFQLSLDKSPLLTADCGIRRKVYDSWVTCIRDGNDRSMYLDGMLEPDNGRVGRNRSGDTGEAGQGGGLALLQNFPLSPQFVQPTGPTEAGGRSSRRPDSPFPEPGSWALLIAGLLGMGAIARPRIYSS